MNERLAIRPEQMEHKVLYRNDKEFCSWPFNGGMWKISEDEVVVAFMKHHCDYTNVKNLRHTRIETFGTVNTVRTVDGGRTWTTDAQIADNIDLSDRLIYGTASAYTEPHDFNNPNTLLSCWSTPYSNDAQAKAWISISADAGRTWGPAVLLPHCEIPRYQGRPSYIVRPDGAILLFLTAKPVYSKNDRPVVFASYDGGCHWILLSFMAGSDDYRVICPSPVLLKDGRIQVAVRCKLTVEAVWSELYESDDGGYSWKLVSRINDHGDTVHLTLLGDGRLFAIYGYRRPGYGVRAKISEDQGRTWGPEMIIREDGGSYDLGYPRAVELASGQILASYYFNEKSDSIQLNGGVRHIAGTLLRI